jgi:hypothetical protein
MDQARLLYGQEPLLETRDMLSADNHVKGFDPCSYNLWFGEDLPDVRRKELVAQ